MKENKLVFLVTGAAGFIGSEVVKKLLKNGEDVIGIDNLNDYYDPSLKRSRLSEILKINTVSTGKWIFHQVSIENKNDLDEILKIYSINVVIHLAAQAGVRNSILNPSSYIQSNLVGFFNILEFCKNKKVNNFIYASSSSVYGSNDEMPFSEDNFVDCPVSLYGATKKSNELIAHSYSHLYKLPTTGLRFFTVYGPWGRPDMAPMIFTKSILEKRKIKIFNNGFMKRDFTFIDDITEGIFRCCYKPAIAEDDCSSKRMPSIPYKIFNIGYGKPIKLMNFINILEEKLGMEAKKEYLPLQKGDVVETWASTNSLKDWIDYEPKTPIEEGIDKFVEWYLHYYQDNDKSTA